MESFKCVAPQYLKLLTLFWWRHSCRYNRWCSRREWISSSCDVDNRRQLLSTYRSWEYRASVPATRTRQPDWRCPMYLSECRSLRCEGQKTTESRVRWHRLKYKNMLPVNHVECFTRRKNNCDHYNDEIKGHYSFGQFTTSRCLREFNRIIWRQAPNGVKRDDSSTAGIKRVLPPVSKTVSRRSYNDKHHWRDLNLRLTAPKAGNSTTIPQRPANSFAWFQISKCPWSQDARMVFLCVLLQQIFQEWNRETIDNVMVWRTILKDILDKGLHYWHYRY